jgi:hypothetical protein
MVPVRAEIVLLTAGWMDWSVKTTVPLPTATRSMAMKRSGAGAPIPGAVTVAGGAGGAAAESCLRSVDTLRT